MSPSLRCASKRSGGPGQTRRPALTIVELLVVVAVVGFLAALLLPAVQSARESSRRVDCFSRLGQLGRALHGFQAAYKVFPPAMPADDNNPNNGGSAWYSPHAHLLPYLEQAGRTAR